MKNTSLRFTAMLTLLAATQASHAVNYTGTQLEGGFFFDRQSFPSRINNNLQIAGVLQTPYQLWPSGDPIAHAATWDGRTAKVADLTPKLDGDSRANGINAAGHVVGSFGGDFNNPTSTAVVWKGNDMTILPGNLAAANAINNHDVIVGSINNSTAYKWEDGVGTALAMPAGATTSTAIGINDYGVIAGNSFGGSPGHAVVWNGSNVSLLDLAAGDASNHANAINNAGQVVGIGIGANWRTHAELWSADGKVTALTDPNDANTISSANDINNSGWIVGAVSDVGGTYGALWMGSTKVNLNQYLDRTLYNNGWRITSARGINDRGDIVAQLNNVETWNWEGYPYLLTVSAVPEPETYAMLLAGLAIVGGIARRRRIA